MELTASTWGSTRHEDPIDLKVQYIFLACSRKSKEAVVAGADHMRRGGRRSHGGGGLGGGKSSRVLLDFPNTIGFASTAS